MGTMLSIGEAAELGGVSVQTLRHYDKLGLLAPSHVSSAGHRRYSAEDCERLRLIRALREVGFDLDTIGRLLASGLEPGEAIELRVEALEAEQRTLRRRQLLLRAVTKGDRKDLLGRLQKNHVLAKLDRLEREAFLERHLAWIPRDTPANEAVWRAAACDLPAQMDDAQLEAWLELAEIVTDERFHSALERQFELGRELTASEESNRSFQRLLSHVVATIRSQREPGEHESRCLLDAWLTHCARQHSRAPDADLTRWLLDRFESGRDPRIDRYWELVSRVKQVPYDPTHAQAVDWVVSALHARAYAAAPAE
jgi:DNA-binding transcriptional MerR regulator